MKYTVKMAVSRPVVEIYHIELEADGADEAEDVAYEVVFDPETDLHVDRLMCISREDDQRGQKEIDTISVVREADEVYDDGA